MVIETKIVISDESYKKLVETIEFLEKIGRIDKISKLNPKEIDKIIEDRL